MREFFEILFHIESDFDYGFACGFLSLIGIALCFAAFAYLLDYFNDLSDMRKEYIDKKNKKLYNHK